MKKKREKIADREKERGREKERRVSIAGLTGFPPLSGTRDPWRGRIAPDSAQISPASPVTQVRHWGRLPPPSSGLSAALFLHILAAWGRGCFASICKCRTFLNSHWPVTAHWTATTKPSQPGLSYSWAVSSLLQGFSSVFTFPILFICFIFIFTI